MKNQNLDRLLCDKISRIKQHILHSQKSDPLRHTFILAATDGVMRAKVHSFIADLSILSSDEFRTEISQKITALQTYFNEPIKWVRLEWVTSAELITWREFQEQLKKYKRNYFRSGIAFAGKKEPWLLLTEMELNANACLYAGGNVACAQVNMGNLTRYFRARHGTSQLPEFCDDLSLYSFRTAGFFFDMENDEIYEISTALRQQGRRVIPPLNQENGALLIQKITTYLSRQIQPSGVYEYGHFPCFGRHINSYNTLRHISSTYALLEGYEFCRTQGQSTAQLAEMKAQIERALDYVIRKIIRHYPDNRAYVVEINEEIKLGGNAVALLALVKYMQVFPDAPHYSTYLAFCERLALGILAMQRQDGRFVHILNAKDLSVVAEQRIIYYDGEAAFGLMRLYGLTRDPRWLDCVARAFDYFIAAGHHRAHDHWLSYCSNELVIYKPEKKYFQFAVDNLKGYVNFIRERITTFPTLLELSMAFHNMLLKLDEFPQFYDVLDDFDVSDFYHALHTRANYLLNGIFFPEMAMFYKFPHTVLYGCFIRHHAFRVRIDDVEHYLSGLIAYHKLLVSAHYPKTAEKIDRTSLVDHNPLTPVGLAEAVQGKWTVAPNKDWQATGMSVYPQSFQAGHLVIARGKNMQRGYLPKVAVVSLVKKGASAVITDNPQDYADLGVPVLAVKNVRQAVLNIARWVRKHFQGCVYGITGSAGKTTTVSMLSHCLSAFGKVGKTQGSANLPIGIAWNMACLAANCTTAQLHNCTTAQLHNCTTAQLHNCTTAQLHNCTTAQLHNCTTAQLHNCTTAQLHNCTTAQLHNCTTAQLHNCTTAQLHNCTTLGVRNGYR